MAMDVHTKSRRRSASRRASSSPQPPSRRGRSWPSSAGRASRSRRRTAAPGSRSSRRPSRGARRALYRGPYFATIGLTLPALPAEERAAVAAGETSWTLAFGPLVPDLDSAEHVAIVGGTASTSSRAASGDPRDDRRVAHVARRRRASPAAGSPTPPSCRDRGSLADGARARGLRRRAARARGRARVRVVARAVRQEDRRVPGRLASARGRVHASSCRARSRSGPRGASRRARQASIAAAAASPYAGESAVPSARPRSRRSAASASPGSTGSTGCY